MVILIPIVFLFHLINYEKLVINLKEIKQVKEYAESYLTRKYGEHKFKVTRITYKTKLENLGSIHEKVGYFVDFKSDILPNSYLSIDGIISDEYEISTSSFLDKYYFPGMDLSYRDKEYERISPREKVEKIISEELQKEFEHNVYTVFDVKLILKIPNNLGRIPTLEDLKNDISLYRLSSFNFKVLYPIENEEEYKRKLKKYIKNKYNCDSDIYFSKNPNNIIDVILKY